MTSAAYRLLEGRHPAPDRVPAHLAPNLALALLAEDLLNGPAQVPPGDLDTALELIGPAQLSRRYAEYVILHQAKQDGLTMEQVAHRIGVRSAASLAKRLSRTATGLALTPADLPLSTMDDALAAATAHLRAARTPRLMVPLTASLMAVWLLHNPRPELLAWATNPTPPHGLDPDDHTAAVRTLNEHSDLSPGTRADAAALIHRTLTKDGTP